MTKTIKCTIADVEERIAALYEDEDFVDTMTGSEGTIEVEDSKDVIVLDGFPVVIPAFKLLARSGTYCRWDEELEDVVPDFGVTVLFANEVGQPMLYWEQDNIPITLNNYVKYDGDMRILPCSITVSTD